MFTKVDYAMVNVSDMDRSIAFYRDVLGLPLKFESPGWTEFDTGTTTLALHPGRPAAAPKLDDDQPTAGTCSLGFSVTDIDVVFTELKKRGARFVMPPTEQTSEGIRLAVCLDPDGLPVSFAQPLAR